MVFIGAIVKIILVTWVVFWIGAIIVFAITGQTFFALLFLVGLSIDLSFIAYEYWKDRRKRD